MKGMPLRILFVNRRPLQPVSGPWTIFGSVARPDRSPVEEWRCAEWSGETSDQEVRGLTLHLYLD